MQMSSLLIAVTGLFYFLICLRRFDFFSVAFFSACVYFLPGFWGYTVVPVGVANFAIVDLEDQSYLVMISVLLVICIGAVIFDQILISNAPVSSKKEAEVAALLAVIMGVVGYVLIILTAKEILLDEDKNRVMQSLNRWYILGATAAPVAAVLAFTSKRWSLFLISMILLLFDVYIGFRTSFAIALIACFTLYLSRCGAQRVAVQNWRLGIIGLLCVCFLFVYKQLYMAVKLGLWDMIIDRLYDAELYTSALLMSEPFNTQAILNEVVAQDFRVGMGHLKDVALQLLLFSPDLAGPPVSFNDLFQATLFPSDLDYGMANNIWAEMLSSGGWPLLSLFLLCFIGLIAVGSYVICCGDLTLAVGAAVAFSYWTFYIHRNDLIYQVNLEKRTLLVWGACWLLAKAVTLQGASPRSIIRRDVEDTAKRRMPDRPLPASDYTS